MTKRNFFKTLFAACVAITIPAELSINQVNHPNKDTHIDNIFSFGYQCINKIITLLNSDLIKNNYEFNKNTVEKLSVKYIITQLKEIRKHKDVPLSDLYYYYITEVKNKIFLNFYHKLKNEKYVYFFEYTFEYNDGKIYIFSDMELLELEKNNDLSYFIGKDIEWKNLQQAI